MVNLNSVSEGFFDTMRIPLVMGRVLELRDMRDTAAVVVDERFATQFFPGQNALGQRFGRGQKNNQYEIVGVVRDSLYNDLRRQPLPVMYRPYGSSGRGSVHFAIRSSMDSTRLAGAVRKAIAEVDPAVPLSEFHTQTALIDRRLRTERLLGFVSAAFGIVSLTLAAVGLGGLLAYSVYTPIIDSGSIGAGHFDTALVSGSSLFLAYFASSGKEGAGGEGTGKIVQFDFTVPEPGTMGLAALALGIAALLRHRLAVPEVKI